jgi:hypothetical protein
MNFDWLHLNIHIMCLFAFGFKFKMHACVVYASCRTWMMIW